jgi:hypothetical protein
MSAWRTFTEERSRELASALESVRAELRSPRERLVFRSAPDAWTNLEIGEHVALVDRYLLILADKIAKKSSARRARGERPADQPSRIDHLEKLASRDFRWPAPEHMRPTGHASPAEIDAELAAQIERGACLLAAMPEGEGSLHTIRMSVVGADDKLDLYQFLCVIELHARRHARAMRRNDEAFRRDDEAFRKNDDTFRGNDEASARSADQPR